MDRQNENLPSKYTELSSDDLLDLLRKGDQSAYHEIRTRYSNRVFDATMRTVCEHIPPSLKALDMSRQIVRGTFDKLWQRRSHYPDDPYIENILKILMDESREESFRSPSLNDNELKKTC